MGYHTDEKSARIYRISTPDYTCPLGLRARAFLEQQGVFVEDRLLHSEEEAESFMNRQGVNATPQIFLGESHIGSFEDLRQHFGVKARNPQDLYYRTFIFVLLLAFALACAICVIAYGTLLTPLLLIKIAALYICLMALLKLQDIENFSNRFISYDLLARRWIGYAYFNPVAEIAIAVLAVAGVYPWVCGPLALAIGIIGTASVLNAAQSGRRGLVDAYPEEGVSAPVQLISLSKNLLLITVGLWAIVAAV